MIGHGPSTLLGPGRKHWGDVGRGVWRRTAWLFVVCCWMIQHYFSTSPSPKSTRCLTLICSWAPTGTSSLTCTPTYEYLQHVIYTRDIGNITTHSKDVVGSLVWYHTISKHATYLSLFVFILFFIHSIR